MSTQQGPNRDISGVLHARGPGDVEARDRLLPLVLASFDPRKSRVAELRLLGGLSLEETGHVLGLSWSASP